MAGKRKRKISNASRKRVCFRATGASPGRIPMRCRPFPPLPLSLSLAAVLTLTAIAPALADGPAVVTKRFPTLVRIFLLPEEEGVLKDLRDDKDRREFQKIFWARRDPTPGTPANEFEDNVRIVWQNADNFFSYPN